MGRFRAPAGVSPGWWYETSIGAMPRTGIGYAAEVLEPGRTVAIKSQASATSYAWVLAKTLLLPMDEAEREREDGILARGINRY